MTLKECIDKCGFGVKFFAETTPKGYWFIPLGFNLGESCAIGEAADIMSQHWMLDSEGWSVSEKPKKKLKLCTYVHYFIYKNGSIHHAISNQVFEPCPERHPIDYKYLTTVKIAETEVEVDYE